MWLRFITRIVVMLVGLMIATAAGLIVIMRQTDPQRDRLTYVVSNEIRENQIVQFDGGEHSILVDSSQLQEIQFSFQSGLKRGWSRDGSRLAFLGFVSESESDSPTSRKWYRLYHYDPHDASLTILAELEMPVSDVSWSWSADGRLLAYSGGQSVSIVMPDSPESKPQTLNLDTMEMPFSLAYSPLWSPTNPNLLAVVLAHPNGEGRIALIEVAEQQVANMTLLDTLEVGELVSWRNDGQVLVYMSGLSSGTIGLYQVDLRTGYSLPLFLQFGNVWEAQWSPVDTTTLAVSPFRSRIFIMDTLDSEMELLATVPDADDRFLMEFSWSPDGRQIAYTAGDQTDGGCALMLVDVSRKIQLPIAMDQMVDCTAGIDWQPGS